MAGELTGWIEIFRAGTWNGYEYSREDMDRLVENFGSGRRDVPVVIGHAGPLEPEKQALGWVAELKRAGNRLMARLRDVSEALRLAVNSKAFPKRSVELWEDLDGHGLTLGAVAYLGGSQPAVYGMPDHALSAEDAAKGRRVVHMSAATEISEDETDEGGEGMTQTNEARTLEAVATVTEPTVQQRIDAAVQMALAETAERLAAAEAQRNAAQAAAEQARNDLAAERRQAELAERRRWSEGLLAAKRVTPAQAERVNALAERCDAETWTAVTGLVEAMAADYTALFKETDTAPERTEERTIPARGPVTVSVGTPQKGR